jgi:hypothetical protein
MFPSYDSLTGRKMSNASEDIPTDERDETTVLPPPLPRFETEEKSELSGGSANSRKRSRKRRLVCFHCNRSEGHSNPYLGSWFYSYFIGATFGLITLIGPFRCQCCGKQRTLFKDWLHPQWHIKGYKNRVAVDAKRTR